ncbi:hypothetical protein TNCV_4731201 [Trichonephila clavipes]|nr:hypothetical protein TNCV_4731201 [Trichonephila clavipes]
MPSLQDLYVFLEVNKKNFDFHEFLFDTIVLDHAPRNIENQTTGHAQPLVPHYLINHSPRLKVYLPLNGIVPEAFHKSAGYFYAGKKKFVQIINQNEEKNVSRCVHSRVRKGKIPVFLFSRKD